VRKWVLYISEHMAATSVKCEWMHVECCIDWEFERKMEGLGGQIKVLTDVINV
jgi:hypothetical protein